MGLGRRLYDLFRSNVNHYLRRGPDLAARSGSDRSSGEAREAWTRAPGGASADGAPEDGAPGPVASPRRRELERRYRALELPWGAGPEVIRQAHRRLMRRFHPDRFARDAVRQAEATRLVQELTAARDVLLAAIERGEIVPRADSGPQG